jgi:hypothetical protein
MEVDRMYEESLRAATQEMRLANLPEATRLLVDDVVGAILKACPFPMYSDVLRMPPEQRRLRVAAVVKTVAHELDRVASHFNAEGRTDARRPA